MALGCLFPLLTAPESVTSVGSTEKQTSVGDGISDYAPKSNTAYLSELFCVSKSQFLLLLILKTPMIFFAVPDLRVLPDMSLQRKYKSLSTLTVCFENI